MKTFQNLFMVLVIFAGVFRTEATTIFGGKFAIGTILGRLIVGDNGSIEGLPSGAVYGAFIPPAPPRRH